MQTAACNIPYERSFDSSTGIFSIIYPIDQFNEYCAMNFVPSLLSYYGEQRSGPTLVLSLDIRSFISAFAVNINVPGVVGSLESVPTSQTISALYALQVVADGILFEANQDFLFRYPGMSPILCLTSINSTLFARTPLCLVSMQDLYGIPIANHMGASSTEPVYCNW